MTDERLAEIEKTSIEAGRIVAEQNIKDLIAALRTERTKVAELDKNNKKLRDAIAILNCMIFCGEQHSERTETMVNDALGFESINWR